MKKAILTIWILAISTSYGQFIQNSSRSLFSDVKAFKPGDALMVYITEETQADNSAQTRSGRTSNVGGSARLRESNSGLSPELGIGTNNDFSGSGATIRSEKIRSKLSARVVDVESNGNLLIEGKRTTQINGETQTIVIKGVVRPVDVMPNNSVYSYSILDLTLLIEGLGSVSEQQEPGLFTKFIRFLF